MIIVMYIYFFDNKQVKLEINISILLHRYKRFSNLNNIVSSRVFARYLTAML